MREKIKLSKKIFVQGDSGGPLQVVDNGKFVLAGIYSLFK
jgi:hypothetical protein